MTDEDYALVRYWFTFDLTAIETRSVPAEIVRLDGGSLAHRLLWRGIGVTGLNENDCVQIIKNAIAPEDLPPVRTTLRNVDVATLSVNPSEIGVTIWRGVWFPALNRAGPKTSTALPANLDRHVFTVWFSDDSEEIEDEDREWPAVFVIVAESERRAREWGTILATDYAERRDLKIISTDVVGATSSSLTLPAVRFGEQPTDELIGW